MKSYQEMAYGILQAVMIEGKFLKQALNDEDKGLNEIETALITKIVYGVLDKNISLDYFISCLCTKKPKNSIIILLKIAMYELYYLKRKDYAVVDNAIKTLKKIGKAGVAGFVNATLRKFSSFEIELPKDELERKVVLYSYPLYIIKKLISQYGVETTDKILSEKEEITTIRLNGETEKYLIDKKIKYEKTPFENVFIVKNFKMDEDFHLGKYTFQSIGSCAICDIIEKGEKLLDACASPGGKSCNLSEKFSQVFATDIHPHRVNLITKYKSRLKIKNIVESVDDSTKFNPDLANKFDAVLCDVPCSGLGVIKENPDILLNRKEEDIKALQKLQLDILNNCKKYVKIGGILYYSTCTFLFEENIFNVKKFLAENKEFESIKIESKLENINDENSLSFLPHISLGAGFFISALRRNA